MKMFNMTLTSYLGKVTTYKMVLSLKCISLSLKSNRARKLEALELMQLENTKLRAKK
jgi:hypothetical protein